ncbi:hypothetical protein LAZ67_13000736, partial [Cordylochernes scorpioides]
MKRAIKSRTVLRTIISKLIKRTEAELNEETPSEDVIRTNHILIEKNIVDLQEEDKLIWKLKMDDEESDYKELEEEKDTVIQYDQKWINLERRVTYFLNSMVKNIDAIPDNSSEKGSLPGTRGCRLPKLELKKFDGSWLEWLGWWAQFSTIHEDSTLSNVDKFQYLVQSMKENTRASRLVKSYPTTADNYPKAISALKDRFGDRVILTEVYVRQLLGLVVNNARRKTIGIEDLYDKLESYLRSLESLGITTEQNAAFLYPLVESSLPEELLAVWQRSALAGYNDEDEDTPQPVDGRLGSLLKFLRREVKGEKRLAYVRSGIGESSNSRSVRPNTTRLHVAEVNKPGERNMKACLFCRGDHWLTYCQKWLAISAQEKRGVLMRHRACFKCFRVGHHACQCWRDAECGICKKSHNTLLHLGECLMSNRGPSSTKENIHPKTESNTEKPDVSFAGMHVRTAVPTALLATALVRLVNHRNEEKVVRSLLDQGSQSSFIHRDVLQGLNIPVSKVDAQIYGINATKGEEVKDLAHFAIKPIGNQNWELPLQALVVNKMTGLLPSKDLRLPITEKFRDIQLADPQFTKSGRIDIILGADVYGLLLLPEIRRDDKTQLCAQNTKLGWIISGGLSGGDVGNTQVFTTRVQYEDNLETILKRFWEVEEVQVANKITPQDEFCEDLYKRSVRRDTNGRYIVPLPFDTRVGMQDCFGNSLDLCVKRQMALERRLALNDQLGRDYYKFMEEYEGLGHMTQLNEIPVGDQAEHCYLPHHAVLGGQPDRRKFRVVFDASAKTKNGFSFNDRLYVGPKLQRDILSILMNCRKHRIFIMSDIEKMYRQILVRPSDAERQRIIWRRRSQDKLIAYRLNTVTYGTAAAPFLAMRTLLKLVEDEGAKYPRASRAIKEDTYVDDIITGADDLRDGMALRDELIELLRCGGFTLKKWSSNDPTILGNIAKEHCAQKIMFEQSKVIRTLGLGWIQSEDCFVYDVQSLEKTSVTTKREMLSFIAKLYDPLGWLAPVLVTGKIMVQRLWITGLHWDDPMDESLIETWTKFRKELNFIRSLRIPRWLGLGRNIQGVQLHGFGDASEDAYAAAVYIRIPNDDGVSVKLLASKTKLAPIQKMSIPRLELCAALLLTRLMKYIMEELNITMESVTCWSDSTIVLSWLKTMSRTLPTFIGNRVAEIQSCPQVREWRYVPTGDNPADIASRGIQGSELKQSSIWWTGPTWLSAESTEWPRKLPVFENKSQIELLSIHAISETPFLMAIGEMSSTFNGFIRKVAWMLRFCHNCRYSAERYQSHLTTAELRNAHGRILQAVHMRTLHGSVHLMLSTLRQKYWMLRAKDQVKRCIRECVTCCRYNRVTQGQLMSDLPKERLTPGKPFSISGVDYAGPVNLRLSKGRGRKTEKGYICLFVCFVTRAVHLELVTDASTPTFMSAFKRFVARRGHCTRLYSDQGTNFVGAARQLRSRFYLAQNQLKELAAVLANDGTEWRFNPPGAPHFGGLWEAGVKALKYHMRRIIGNNLLTYEELLTVLVQIESCLNSRPLYPMSNDPNDQRVLPPAHFLLAEPSSCVPEDDLLLVKNHLLTRWQLVQRVLQHLWKRWSKDYLNNLQQRNKWKTISPNVDVNTLVLIKEERMPPASCVGANISWSAPKTLGEAGAAAGNKRKACERVLTKNSSSRLLGRPARRFVSASPFFEMSATQSLLRPLVWSFMEDGRSSQRSSWASPREAFFLSTWHSCVTNSAPAPGPRDPPAPPPGCGEPARMKRDKKLRSVTRTRFTKVVNILDPEIRKTDADLGVVKDQFSKLKDIDCKLKDLDQKMVNHMMLADVEEDALNCEIEEAEHYSDTFITLERRVREVIESDNKMDVKSLGSTNGSSMAKGYRLPKFELRTFDGELINWLPFWAQFEKIHEDNELHDADKFHYLVQSMQSSTRARELIESYPQTAENYAKAVQALKQRYGQKDLLVEIYVRELLKLMMANVRTPPDERRSVAKLYDKLETQLRSLESLGVDTKENTAWLFPMIESCLPEDVLVAWQRSPLNNCDASRDSNSNSSSRLNNLLDFLRREVEGEERRLLARRGFEGFSPKEKLRNMFKQNSNVPTAAGLFSAKEMGCLFCEKNHQSKDCITAQSMPFKDKRAKIYEKRCCLKCLKPGHLAKACKRTVQCNICAKGHYVLLCPDLPCNRKENTHVSEVVQSALANQQCTRDVTLMTLMVNIMGNNGYKRVRALLDPGSQKSYILESTALEVKLKPVGNVNIAHSLFGGTQTETKCHKITRTPKGAWLNELKGSRIWLSDLGRDSPKIELLIGSDIYGSLLSGRVKQLENGLTAIETHLGWTICGPSPKKDEQSDCSSLVVISMHSRNMSVDYLWNLETIGIKDPRENLTKLEEDKVVHQHFLNTVHQLEDGRFCVGLPWLGNQEGIPSNRHIAERRLFNTTRKLRAKCIFSEYDRVFQEWLAEGVIEKVSPEDLNRNCHYLPHHPVVKANSNTTKIRPVFDASCKDKGNLSLNDCLASGPNVIEQIPAILLKFRENAIGVIADIRKAFLQIEVKEEDRDYLRFLWWKNNNQIQVFRHKRVVFGVTCSPYLLGAVILHHLKGVSSEFGALPQKLMECLYIDNCVTSVDTEAELVDLVEKSTEIFAKAKMDLRMWQFGPIHRIKEVYSRLPPSVDIERSEEASVLGMKWNLLEDTLNVTPKFGVIKNSLSKRDLLSHTQQIFDPIGFLAPVLLPAKLLIQQAWTVKTDWDEPLPSNIQENFMKWYSELDTLADIKIPRRVGHGIRAHWSIHIFCDASQSAYAAAAFLRCPENKGVSVQLLMAKSRLGPLKKTTIPRMELLACMLGVRLGRYITESLNLAAEPVYYWTDSTTALSWIKTNRQWGTFVNNRVKEICNTSGPNKWFYVPGSLNPADLPSRGCSVLQLKRTRWWEGPEWLKQPQDHWPKQLFHSDRTLVNLEIDRQVLVTTHVRTEVMPWFERFSNFTKIVRINAWIRRFIRNTQKLSPLGMHSLQLSELEDAEKGIWKTGQQQVFSSRGDSINGLMIIRDDFGLIRIKSKLIERDDEYSFRYPILLPTKHHVVTCLIREFHLKHCHTGVQILSAKLRENYWILNSRRSIRSVVSQCARCRRFSSKPVKTIPIHLPLDRVRGATAFEILGVDLAGPLYLKNKTKAWIVLFTCAVFRAIHLELVTSLSTEAFIQALRRFIARRGRPTVIYSENGTNFVGANNDLRALNWKKIVLDQDLHKINWKFIPPTAAWWGGWWERLIRSIKDLIVRILGHSSVYYEEMSTILCDVEATINSRPLTYIHEDFDSLIPLSPSMFLHDSKYVGVPDLDKLDSKKFQDRYRHCQRLREALRSRFRSEYLGQLVQKANERTPKLSVGDVVIVKVEDKRRLHWPMARIVELFPGRDGHSRVAKVRTKLGTLIRPVQKLYPLEVSSGDPILRSREDTAMKEEHSGAKRTRCGRVVKPPERLNLRAKEIPYKQRLVDGKKSKKRYPTSRVSWTERHLGGSLKQQLEDGKGRLRQPTSRDNWTSHKTSQASDGAATREAYRVVASYPVTGANYALAVQALQERFGDPNILTELYVRRLLNSVISNVKKENRNLSSLYDELSSHLRSLETLGIDPQLSSIFLYPLVESSLPSDILKIWHRHPSSGYGLELAKREESDKGVGGAQERLRLLLDFLKAESQCREQLECKNCGRNHLEVLCEGNSSNRLTKPGRENLKENAPESIASLSSQACTGQVLLMTTVALLRGPNASRRVRILLDSGSQFSYIKQSLVWSIRIERKGEITIAKSLFGGNKIGEEKHGKFMLELENLGNKRDVIHIEALDQREICDAIPPLPKGDWLEKLKIKGIILSQDNFKGQEIDILIGANYLGMILTGKIVQVEADLTAVETKLGWTLMGNSPIIDSNDNVQQTLNLLTTRCDLKDLWDLEVLGIRDPVETCSKETRYQEIKEKFITKIQRQSDQRYSVGLPWKVEKESIPSNLDIAIKRLDISTKKMTSQNKLTEYSQIFRDWLTEGLIERVKENPLERRGYYLPHRPVYKMESKTTPIRPVFDASCLGHNGLSLNQCLEKGPNLLERIPDMMIRFRENKFGVTADIRKAFQMVAIEESERNYLRFLWWEKESDRELIAYRHKRLVFGLNCSPFVLNAVIEYHLQSIRGPLVQWAKILAQSFYMDNCITSLETKQEVQEFQKAAIEIMDRAKMDLREWEYSLEENPEKGTCTIILGVVWNKMEDSLKCELPDNLSLQPKLTKRLVLSMIPRYMWNDLIFPTEVHIFCDASQIGYGAVAYLRSETGRENTLTLIWSKVRLAPMKSITIPRLELMAMVLGARLANAIQAALKRKCETTLWSDSTTALSWIKKEIEWRVFLRNRVREIQATTNLNDWRFVPSQLNPADLLSRGCPPSQFVQSRWWEGPEWLKKPKELWPNSEFTINPKEIKVEENIMKTNINLNIDYKDWILTRRSNYSLNIRVPEEFKTPIILPGDHPFVEQLIWEVHLKNGHVGVQFFLSKLREKFWIIRGRKTIKKIISKGIACKRLKEKSLQRPMAALPENRIGLGKPFQVTGVDLLGPLHLKESGKVWVAAFTCAVYRAIHLELVKSLETGVFMMALHRFICRRGRPEKIYSDNGTNFAKLNRIFKRLDWTRIERETSIKRIQWIFIPPSAPWWGGFWERMVRTIKEMLIKMLGHRKLKYVQLQTALCEIESIINNRPLTYVCEDDNDLKPLTPNEFLQNGPESSFPEFENLKPEMLHTRYRELGQLKRELKQRFLKEYLGALIQKSENIDRRQLKVGDVVLIGQENLKRMFWPKGRIVNLIPGKDGIQRIWRTVEFPCLGADAPKKYPTSSVLWTERSLRRDIPQAESRGRKDILEDPSSSNLRTEKDVLDNQRVATIGHRTRQAKPATVLPHE